MRIGCTSIRGPAWYSQICLKGGPMFALRYRVRCFV